MAGKLNVTEDPKAHLVRLVKDFDNAMLITKNSSDQLRGRPMRIAKADVEQNLWFITSMDSAKIEELLRDPRACITMQKSTHPPPPPPTPHPLTQRS
jgi:general stress protein 26